MKSVAVVIPTLNEAAAIRKVINEIPDEVCGSKTNIFVIDGGSSDGTCNKVENSRANLIRQSYSGGKGSAVRESLEEIDAEVYVFIDGDKTYCPEEMDRLVKPILESDHNHVMGSRLAEREEDAFMYRNLLGNKIYSWMFRRLSDSNINDFLTGYRAISRELAEKIDLESKEFQIETEITFKTLELGEEIKEVDISYMPRVGESNLNFAVDGPKIFLYALKLSLLK